MDPLKDAFAASIRRAERTMRQRRKVLSQDTPQERGHEVAKLADERARRRREEAETIARNARLLALDAETLAKIDAAATAYADTHERWIFVMLSPAQNAEVIRWINRNSKRPHKAVELWATILEHLRIDTGEVMATRQELAERVGMEPRTLSETMTEFVSINAIRREKQGRAVRYFLNPTIATHLPSASKRAAAREEAGPLLRLMEGGKVDDAPLDPLPGPRARR